MINRREFNEGKFEKACTKKEHPIITFLRTHRSNAFTAKEIVKETGINENTIRTMLRKFRIAKIVQHKSPYFIICSKN